jgi:hypothetical protein
MLRQIDQDHGRGVALAVITQMRLQCACRYAEAMAVFESLPPMPFEDALLIKAERADASVVGRDRQTALTPRWRAVTPTTGR